MCGRFTSSAPDGIVAETFGLAAATPLTPRYNLAPTQAVPVVRWRDGGRRLDALRWGLVPSWAKDPTIGNRLINARAETVADKPAFRGAFRQRRCLVVADGFFEWDRTPGGRRPWLIRFRDSRPFGMAGVWETWRGPEGELETCTILTTTPNAVVAPLHDRMPVILSSDLLAPWLDPACRPEHLPPSWPAPFPPAEMTAQRVSLRVNDPTNDDPSLLKPVA